MSDRNVPGGSNAYGPRSAKRCPRSRRASASERSGPHGVPRRAAYAVLATRFPEETCSRAMMIGGNGPGKLQIAVVAALVAAIILIVAKNLS